MYVLHASKNSKQFLVIFLMLSGRVDPEVQKYDKKWFWFFSPKGLVLLPLAHMYAIVPEAEVNTGEYSLVYTNGKHL